MRTCRPGRAARWVCAASIAALAGCSAPTDAGAPSPPRVVLEEVRFQSWRGAEPSASGTAARVVYRKSSGDVEAEEARVTSAPPGAPALSLEASRLEGDAGAHAWRASGGVVLTRGEAVARTASARWSEGDGLVRGDEPVRVEGPGWKLEGPAFVADPATGDVSIRGGARLVAGGKRP